MVQSTSDDKSLEALHRFHTKELLGMLNAARRCGGGYDPFYDGLGRAYTIEEFKSVLANRAHVPSKIEAKRIRQQRAGRK